MMKYGGVVRTCLARKTIPIHGKASRAEIRIFTPRDINNNKRECFLNFCLMIAFFYSSIR